MAKMLTQTDELVWQTWGGGLSGTEEAYDAIRATETRSFGGA